MEKFISISKYDFKRLDKTVHMINKYATTMRHTTCAKQLHDRVVWAETEYIDWHADMYITWLMQSNLHYLIYDIFAKKYIYPLKE